VSHTPCHSSKNNQGYENGLSVLKPCQGLNTKNKTMVSSGTKTEKQERKKERKNQSCSSKTPNPKPLNKRLRSPKAI
jgi:hypothetical protein